MLQKTIKRKIKINGIGLHSGKKTEIVIYPHDNSIYFLKNNVKIPALYNYITDTTLNTCLEKDNQKIHTIEHLLSAISGFGIDSCIIEVVGDEVPILDGSSLNWIQELMYAGEIYLDKPKKYLKILKEVSIEEGDKFVKLLPLSNHFILEIEVDFYGILNDSYAMVLNNKNYIDLCTSRTFTFEKEVEYLRSKNLALGGSLQNAIVLNDTGEVINEHGYRTPHELVKHKMLDSIGDLYLSGYHIKGFYKGNKPGHSLNNQLLHKLFSDESNYEIIE